MMMTPVPTGVAVIATQLPGIDRRALSQAWYSALHLADRHGSRGSTGAPHGQTVAHASAPAIAASRESAASASARPPLAARNERTTRSAVPAERRAPRTDLARRIERALAPRPRAPIVPSASLAMNAGDGRVHLLVRTDGGTTRIVALCAPALKERVEAALAQARFTLAAAGVSLAVESR